MGYRITILLTCIWTLLLPFLWAFHLSVEFNLPSRIAWLAYRAELLSVIPSAILLTGAWKLKRWAIPGLCVGALAFALLKITLGGAPTGAWKLGGFLFISLALRLWFLLKAG
jgi:hypothetical protein